MAIDLDIPTGSRVLVTGASGYTGQVLTRKLVALGFRVRAVARTNSNLKPLEDLPIEWIRGEVYDPHVTKQAVVGVEYLFHVAAAYREAKISDETYYKVHVESTKLLAQALNGSPNFKRFVHVSTVGVHGHIEEPPADESYRFDPGDIYQRTKAEGELWIAEYARSTGLPITIVRPAAIYGPGDRRLLKLFKLAGKPIFPLFGAKQGFYHLIHVEDLTDIFITAALHPEALGQAFIAGNPSPTRLEDIVRTIASELNNKRLCFLRLPAWPLFLAADLCEALCKPFGIEPPLYRRRVAFFTKDRAFDTSKLQKRLGYRYTVDVEAGLRNTARWYLEQGWL